VDFDLGEVINEIAAATQYRCQQKGLTLHVAPPLAATSLWFRGDPGRVRQVLLNLCDNAVKFTECGGLTLSLGLEPVDTSAAVLAHMSVADTGVGIAPDKQKLIFEAFSQADASTTRHYGGTGLGLTISARLVGLMGGHIWVDSVQGEGSTFHVRIPLGVASVSKSEVHDPAPVSPAQSPDGAVGLPPASPSARPLTVLLVEDHPVNQLLARTLLTKWGHEVVLAENGQIAVDVFPSRNWDIVLMDMQMPVMGGLEAARHIRALENPGQRVPIVAVTANAMDSDRQATREAGMDDHLSKPFNAAAMQAMLDRHCPRH